MAKGDAWFLLIAGLIMGTVFTFGMQYWNAPISQEEAICTTAVYTSYTEQLERGHVKEMIVRFEDQLTVRVSMRNCETVFIILSPEQSYL